MEEPFGIWEQLDKAFVETSLPVLPVLAPVAFSEPLLVHHQLINRVLCTSGCCSAEIQGSVLQPGCFSELVFWVVSGHFNNIALLPGVAYFTLFGLKQYLTSVTVKPFSSQRFVLQKYFISVFLFISLFMTKCLEHVYYAVCHLLYRMFTMMQINGKKFKEHLQFLLNFQEKCCQYWPSEGSVTHGEITVEIKNDSLLDAISVRDFLVTYNQVTSLNYMRFLGFFLHLEAFTNRTMQRKCWNFYLKINVVNHLTWGQSTGNLYETFVLKAS